MKVSVIMAVYSGEKYLAEAIDSILSQTLADFEFIIVNDASVDGTADILKDYQKKDGRINLITNPVNIGLTKSLNKALQAARGEYIARQDADDISLPERIEKQVAFLENNKDIAMLGTFGLDISKEGNMLRKETLPVLAADVKKYLIRANPFIHTSVMVRKKTMDDARGYDEHFGVAQDYELWFRILKNGNGSNLPLFLVKKRYQPEMISFKNNKQQLRCAILLKRAAIQSGDYSKFCYVYVMKSYLSLVCPMFLKLAINKYIFKRPVY